MFNYYKVSKDKLKELLKDREVSEEQWNEYVQENGLFTSKSMKAILEVETWEELVNSIKQE